MNWLETVHLVIGREDTDIAWWQMSARAVIVFAYGLFLVRLAGRRVFGQWSPLDIVVSLIIGSNLSRALTGTVPLAQTLLASTVLVLLHGAITALLVRVPALSPFFKGLSVPLARDGEADETALRKSGMGAKDFEEALRVGGVSDVSEVKIAHLERNGRISVV